MNALHRDVLLDGSSPAAELVHDSSPGGKGGKGRRETPLLPPDSTDTPPDVLLVKGGCMLATGVPEKDTFSAVTCGIGTGRGGRAGGAVASCAASSCGIGIGRGGKAGEAISSCSAGVGRNGKAGGAVASCLSGASEGSVLRSPPPPTGFRRTLFNRANSRCAGSSTPAFARRSLRNWASSSRSSSTSWSRVSSSGVATWR